MSTPSPFSRSLLTYSHCRSRTRLWNQKYVSYSCQEFQTFSGLPNFLFEVNPGFFLRKKNRPRRETEYLTISSAEAENEWRYTSTPPICIQGNHVCHLSSQTCVYEMQGKGELQSLRVLFAAPCVLISCWCSTESSILVCSISSAFFLDALRLRAFHSSQSFKNTTMKKIICPQLAFYVALTDAHGAECL